MLEQFINEYKKKYCKQNIPEENELLSFILEEEKRIYKTYPNPRNTLRNKFKRLERRVFEPIKVAIVGQFSSGKSTFLNALLSHNILPSGITPVTAKISYIKYGDKFRLKVVYKDLKEEFYPLDEISNFTDQRDGVEEIAHLVLYAPIEFLKDITFVDTPGLNSQSSSDTKETLNVLEKVDGIIWLTLIDNAGKQSEAKMLEEFILKFGRKSLCVLNQKDKHTKQNINKTVEYIQKEFSKYFEEVVAISARDALNARSNTKKQQKENLKFSFIDSLTNNNEISQKNFDEYNEKLEIIESFDEDENEKLLKESNINSILKFIDTKIRPNADTTKQINLKKELQNVEAILQNQTATFKAIYGELDNIKKKYENWLEQEIESIKKKFTKELENSFVKIEDIVDVISLEIFKNIKPNTTSFLESKKTRFGSLKYEEKKVNIFHIDEESILKKLFFDDELVHKLFKAYIKTVDAIKISLELKTKQMIEKIENEVLEFMRKYEHIEPTHRLESQVEFANMRKFVSNSHEKVVTPYEVKLNETLFSIILQFNKISNNISARYENATNLSIYAIKRAIDENFELYKKNPSFGVYEPTQNEIKEHLKRYLNLEMLENLMSGKRNFLVKKLKGD